VFQKATSLALLLLAGLAPGASSAPGWRADVVAHVGAREITATEVVARARHDAAAVLLDRPLGAADLERALERVVDEAAIEEQARRRGLSHDDGVVRRLLVLAVLNEDVLRPICSRKPLSDEVRRFYDDHPDEWNGRTFEKCERDVAWRFRESRKRELAEGSARAARERSGVTPEEGVR